MKRRLFLRGLCGSLMALPLLEGLSPRGVHAAPVGGPFAIFVRQGNGVQQANSSGEPERFWPSFAPGPLTRERMLADNGRAVSELADHAARLTFVRGICFNDPANQCKHSGGGNQVLTAAAVSSDDCNATLALGESIDNRIVRQLGAPGEEPITLYAGRKTGFLDEVLSYRGPRELRAAERNPYNAYLRLFGLTRLPANQLAELASARKSVNDLVRAEMTALLSRGDLSSADRKELELHFSSIRDLELRVSCDLSAQDISGFEQAAALLDDDAAIESLIRLQCDVLTLAVACGAHRAATLQIGSGPDSTRYLIDGVAQGDFHAISHRVPDIADAALLHHKIDRKFLVMFKYLLDRLSARTTPQGPLVDQGVTVFVNDLGDGAHSYENVPYLIAGSAAGALSTGQFIDVGRVTNNRLLNTLGAAVGCTTSTGTPLDDFGDPTLQKGRIAALVARG